MDRLAFPLASIALATCYAISLANVQLMTDPVEKEEDTHPDEGTDVRTTPVLRLVSITPSMASSSPFFSHIYSICSSVARRL